MKITMNVLDHPYGWPVFIGNVSMHIYRYIIPYTHIQVHYSLYLRIIVMHN